MAVSIQLGPGRPRYRVVQDPGDVDRLHLRFVPSLVRRVAGLALAAGASYGVLAGVRGEGGALVGGMALACAAVVVAFGRSTLVLDRRRGRVEKEWGAPWLFARLLEGRGPLAKVVLARVEEVHERDDTTVRKTTYPVSIRGSGGTTRLPAFPTWEAGRDCAEVAARFLGVSLEDEVHERSVPPDRLDETLARGAEATEPRKRRPCAGVRWNGEDELVAEIPRPGRPMARRFLALLAMAAFWMVIALCAGAVVEALLPLVLVAAAGLKLSWGYGATVTANAQGLTVLSRGLLGRRRTRIPLAELESLLLLRPEWGGPRGLLAEFFEGVLVARSDRAAVRFGHGLSRGELGSLQGELTRLFVRLGHARELVGAGPEPPAAPTSPAPAVVAGLVGGLVGARLGPPASFCLDLPVLSLVLNVLGVSAALLAWWLTRRPGPAPRGWAAGGAGLVALAFGLWLGLDVFRGWIAPAPDRDVAAFRAALEREPGPQAQDVWLAGLTGPQAVTFFLGVLGVALVAAWALALAAVPFGVSLARRWAKKPTSLLPLRPPPGGTPPVSLPAPAAWRRRQAPAVLAALALLWSAALAPGAFMPLTRARDERRAREAEEERESRRERVAKERTARALLRLEAPPPGGLSRGRPALWYFADYLGGDAAIVEHVLWLRQAYAAASLHVVGFPADVHGDALAALLEERGWYGDHAADAAEAAAYRAWAGLEGRGPSALLLDADGSVRDRLQLPWDAEERLAAWLGPPALPRPARATVAIELHLTYAGHPAALPAEGAMTVLARDAWDHSHTFWFRRRGSLPRGTLPLTVRSGTWHVRVEVTAFSGERWTPAFDGRAFVPLPSSGKGRPAVEVPLQVALRVLTPEPGAAGFPEEPAYPASAPPVLSWSAAPEADRYEVAFTRFDAAESSGPRRETLSGTRLSLASLPPGRYEVTVEARRGDLRLGVLETIRGGAWRPGFRFELVR